MRARVPRLINESQSRGYIMRQRTESDGVPRLLSESQSPQVTQGEPESPYYSMSARVPGLLKGSQSPQFT